MLNRMFLSLLLAVVLLLAVSLLAGCGGGDEADEDVPRAPTEHITMCSLPVDSTTNVCPQWKAPTP